MAGIQGYRLQDDLNNYHIDDDANGAGVTTPVAQGYDIYGDVKNYDLGEATMLPAPLHLKVDCVVPNFFNDLVTMGPAVCAEVKEVTLLYTIDHIPSSVCGATDRLSAAGIEIGEWMMRTLKQHGLRPDTVTCVTGGPFRESGAQTFAEGWKRGVEREARVSVFRFGAR